MEIIIAKFYLYKDMDVKCYNKLFLIGKVHTYQVGLEPPTLPSTLFLWEEEVIFEQELMDVKYHNKPNKFLYNHVIGRTTLTSNIMINLIKFYMTML